jgi:hypothetical protein
MLPRAFLMALLGWALSGCSDDDRDALAAPEPMPETTRYENVGAVCLSPTQGGTQVLAILNACESFCADVQASCGVTIVDGAIKLQANGAAVHDSTDVPCRAACKPVVATCSFPQLAAGSHELVYGERSATVQLPLAPARTEALPGSGPDDCTAAAE